MPADSNAEAPGSDFDRDQEHLRLLAIFHYVVGGLCIVFSSFFLLHVGMAIAMYLNPVMLPAPPHGAPPPREVWLLLAAVASGAIALGWSVGILTIISGRMLAKRRHRIFSSAGPLTMAKNDPHSWCVPKCLPRMDSVPLMGGLALS